MKVETRWVVGLDISTQSVSALLVGIESADKDVCRLLLDINARAHASFPSESSRKDPDCWVDMLADLIRDLKARHCETSLVESIGVSTTFPGTFPILDDGKVKASAVRLYDNQDVGALDVNDGVPPIVEHTTANRVWPGTMLAAVCSLLESGQLNLSDTAAILPCNTAFAYTLLSRAGCCPDPRALPSDFTNTVIGCLYDAHSYKPVPEPVAHLIKNVTGSDAGDSLSRMLPRAKPSWTNVIDDECVSRVASLLDLPRLQAVSIGCGDSALGTLPFAARSNQIVNVRGSSDTPIATIDHLRQAGSRRENVLHFPTAYCADPGRDHWHVAAPILRTGRVWDWVKSLRGGEGELDADSRLETLAREAFLRTPPQSRLGFTGSLGGERAPLWEPDATASIAGLRPSHGIGDIALAALINLSNRLAQCVDVIRERYDSDFDEMILAGGPTANSLWNWITQTTLGLRVRVTPFTDSTLLGAAILGYGSLASLTSTPKDVADLIRDTAELASTHELVSPKPVERPSWLPD